MARIKLVPHDMGYRLPDSILGRLSNLLHMLVPNAAKRRFLRLTTIIMVTSRDITLV